VPRSVSLGRLQRQALDEKLRNELIPEQRATLLRLLKVIAELEF
jgi:hypothetical protein